MARILAQVGAVAVDADGAECAVRVARTMAAPWYLWPCNVPTWNLWSRVQTQWRVGMAGATGLDYAGVWAVLHNSRLRPRQARLHFERIQSMERAALKVWDDKRNADNKD